MASDVQHNIDHKNIINNSEDIQDDYKLVNKNPRTDNRRSHDRVEGAILFRLLIPGPANLRGRTEAYKVTR